MGDTSDKAALDAFCEYLSHKDDEHPNPTYATSVPFIVGLARSLGLDAQICDLDHERCAVVATASLPWPSQPAKSLMLTSHIDVVPAGNAHRWIVPPFAGKVRDGKVYGRGAQDMKCVGVAQLFAVARLLQEADTALLHRATLHVVFVPDEEVGSARGMALFVQTPLFRAMGVGLVLDESLPSPTEALLAFPAERMAWWLRLRVRGASAGHGSGLLQGTAVERCARLLQTIYAWRSTRVKALCAILGKDAKSNDDADNGLAELVAAQGEVSSVNVTGMETNSAQINRVPDEAVLSLDLRIGPDLGLDGARALVADWQRSVPGVSAEDVQPPILPPTDAVCAVQQKAIAAIQTTLKDVTVHTGVMPGGTDSRFVRAAGVAAVGLSPFRNTPPLLHDYNEHLSVDVFYEGISLMQRVVSGVLSIL